jgi:hypothetical protein
LPLVFAMHADSGAAPASLLAVADRWLHASLRAGSGARRRARLCWLAPHVAHAD